MHNASLIPDDIEDMAEKRRGEPCIHHRYGMDVAVNASLFMYMQPWCKVG